ncbi:MAG: hypothetical protein CMG98_14080 [Marinovum sp.]|nr:hypothetical protein [Marinovum sp.]
MSYLEYRVRSVPTGMRKILYLNWPLTILIISAAGFGFLMLYSVAGGSLRPWAEPQMKRFALGFLIMLVIAMTPIWAWRNLSFVGYALSLILLLLVELFGVKGMGAQRWIDLGFMRLQPSELAKITLVMALAGYYDMLPRARMSRPIWVILPVGLILLPTLIVLRQPDLGTALLLLISGGAVMYLAGVHWVGLSLCTTVSKVSSRISHWSSR